MRPTIHSTETLIRGEFYSLQQDRVLLSDGRSGVYVSLQLGDNAAVLLAQDKEGRYILNREYRHPTGEYLLGCPGGRLESQEDPLDGGKRELLEETGYWAGSVQLLGSCYPFPGLCNQKIYFLLALDCEKTGAQKLDPLELISIELKSEAELKAEIKNTSHIDGILCTALWYKELFR